MPARMGGYEVVPNWPRWPDDAEHEGWTWGSASGAWAESPDKVEEGALGRPGDVGRTVEPAPTGRRSRHDHLPRWWARALSGEPPSPEALHPRWGLPEGYRDFYTHLRKVKPVDRIGRTLFVYYLV
jgi:hypothetical protein